MKFEITDCGRKEAGFKEKRDCTVRAVSACLDISYSEAHEKMQKLGRKNGCGFTFREPEVQCLGLELCPEFCCRKLVKILPELSEGRFIVRVRRHVFAVVNGVVLDNFEPQGGKNVLAVYRVKGGAA